MHILKESNSQRNFSLYQSLLLCSLFTLAPNKNLFKYLSVKDNIFIGCNEKDYIQKYSDLFQTSSLQKLCLSILEPLLLDNTNLSGRLVDQTNLLKKYLKKYKYTYYRYFFPLTETSYGPPTIKRINTAAIESLFLILGV